MQKSYFGRSQQGMELGSVYVCSENHLGLQKSLKTCYLFNISRIYFEIVRRRTEMTHEQRVDRSESRS